MRKTYGNTWWGKQWLNALKNIDFSNRLPRGRTYANKGAAKNIHIKENLISAQVQGSRRKPYEVDFEIPLFTHQEKATIVKVITANPLYLSQLLNRQLPTELFQALKTERIALFPASWANISGECSCPDWAVPCKHMAAVLYLVANEIDKNPFMVFQLHGFDLFEALEEEGYAAAGAREIQFTTNKNLWLADPAAHSENVWEEEVFQQFDLSTIPSSKANLIAILNEKPVFFPDGDFKAILDKAYTQIAKKLSRKKVNQAEEVEHFLLDTIERVEIILDHQLNLLQCCFRDSSGEEVLSFDELDELSSWLELLPTAQLSYVSPSLKMLHLAWLFANKLAQQSAIIPQLIQVSEESYKIRWIPALLNSIVKEKYDQFSALLPAQILFYQEDGIVFSAKVADQGVALISLFLNEIIAFNHPFDYKILQHSIGHLFFEGGLATFSHFENKEYPAAIQLWLNKFFLADRAFIPILKVHDKEMEFEVSAGFEDKSNPIASFIELENILKDKQYKSMRMVALRDLAMLADFFPQIGQLVASKGERPLSFSSKSFVGVLFNILPTIRLLGIKILLPKALRKLLRPQLSMLVQTQEEAGVTPSGIISMQGLLRFQWQIAMGDQLMTAEDFRALIKELSGIVKLNDQYVFFDEKEIQNLIHKLEHPPKVDGNQLLQIALAENYNGATVKLDQRTRDLIEELMSTKATPVPKGLKAQLRPYQQRGYEWLYKNSRLGFGSLIADDMGLGKTLQVISTLLKLKEDGELVNKKALAIVPTTLLTNWHKEIRKFAPSLAAHIYHGSNRNLDPLKEADILLTTYGVVRSETKLQKVKWLAIIIDEAQNIKNPATIQTRAVKKLKAPIKIAMSGTPVENRLSEYWSIFDYTNKGYLGNLSKFKEKFAKPIEVDRDQQQLKQFRKVTAPFILRRLKSDKTIIKDLPDKIEKDQFCSLTPAQTAIYQNVIDTTLKTIEEAEGINRRGLILKLITALKQICNHPTHFLKRGEADPLLSGKASMLFNLLPQVLEAGEKTLIFTQYQEMGKLLVEMLHSELQLEVPFLHGGVSRKGRDKMVEGFQNDRATRVMILSLKAGGTGLNLTAASNVVHYDLWWNPAVEAQATDRAYRIGQQNNVMVHRFITKGTFEEKINQLLLQKKELAELAVSTGEKWIGELSNSEIKELVQLG